MICLAKPPRRVKLRRLDDARRSLASNDRVRRLASVMAGKFARQFPYLREEFESAANFALVQAARTFDVDLDIKFSTHARNRIHGSLLDVLRDQTPTGYRRGEEAPTVTPAGDRATLTDLSIVEYDYLVEMELANLRLEMTLPDEPDEPPAPELPSHASPKVTQGMLFSLEGAC